MRLIDNCFVDKFIFFQVSTQHRWGAQLNEPDELMDMSKRINFLEFLKYFIV